MSTAHREKAIFLQALEKKTARERNAFLDEACADDSALRQRVEELLNSSDEAGNFLDGHAIEAVSNVESLDRHGPVSLTAEGPGTVIGPYKLMEQIGEGGFGLVFVAEQIEPVRRRVALKLIKPGMDSRDVIRRFEAERQALALMDHPHIARVLDAGTTESGRPYFVMELVRGIPITEYCDQCQLTPTERLELFVVVCRAIQHAHQKGIIHRDVKPSNILVTLHDGEPVVKVIDFGVAKALNQQLTQKTVYTKFSQMIGTPLYMSPEQAEMSGLDVDTRSDIYSLGVLLYELLTGSTPYDRERLSKAAFDEIRRIIREEDPPKPSTRLSTSGDRLPSLAAQRKMEPAKLSKVMRGELDWIVMKALEKDRNRRYETANGFAADILRYLSNDTVEACPPTAGYRLRKFARRNKTLFATSALVAATLIVGTIVSTWQAVRANRAETRAKQLAARARESAAEERKSATRASAETARAVASESELRERVYASDMNVVGQAFAAGTIDRMNELLENHRPLVPEQDQRGLEWYHWWRAGHLERGKARHSRTASFLNMAVSPDGRKIAVSGWPRHLFLYDTETLCLLRSPIQVRFESNQTCFSPDGNFLVVDGVDGEWRSIGVRVLDTRTWEAVATLESGGDNVMAFAMKKPLLAIASWDQIRLWTWTKTSWELQARWSTKGKAEQLAMTPDGKVLVARMTSDRELNSRIDVWNVETRKLTRTINDGQKFDSIAMSSDGNMLAVAERDGDVRLWTLASLTASEPPSPIGVLSTSARMTSLAFSPDSKRLVGGASEKRNLVVWENQGDGFGPPITIRAHSRQVSDVGFGKDPNIVYSTGRDGYLKVWDLSRCQPYDTIRRVVPKSQVGYADDNTLIFHGQDGFIQRWDVKAHEPHTPLDKQRKYHRIAMSDNGEFLAGVTHDDKLLVWDLTNRRVVHETSVAAESDCRLVVSRNGRRVAYTVRGTRPIDAGFGNTLLIHFENETRKTTPDKFLGRLNFDRWQAFSPDSNQLVIQRSGFSKFNSHVLDVTADPIEERYQVKGWGPELCAAFSRDGSKLAIGSYNYDIRIHDAANGALKHTLRGHTDLPNSLVFTKDGSRLVSAGSDATVRVWKIGETQCRLLSTLVGHSGRIEFVAVSPEGTSAASVGEDGTLLVWRTAIPSEVDQDVNWRLDRAVTVSDLDDALRIAPNNLQALSMRGQLHLAAGEWESAIADFDRALELVGDNHYFLQLRAEARAQLGQLNESLDDWTRLVQLTDGANAEYLYRRGECYLMLGRRKDAYADFLQALGEGLTAVGHSTALIQQIESSLLLAQAVVPNGAAWRYTTNRPADGWNTPEYAESSWLVGASPFGSRITARTIWSSAPEMWLRKTFELDREIESPLMLRVLADDYADVYVNGVFAAHVSGSTESYMTVECSREAHLCRGKNTIAVHCVDEGWDAAAIDVGLYVQGDPTTMGKLLAAAEERNPNIRGSWNRHLIDQGRMKEAAVAFGNLVKSNPSDALIRMQTAILYAYNEDLDRFHQLSSRSLELFAETEIPSSAERIAKACLVAPPLKNNLQAITALADKALTLDSRDDRFLPWAQLTKALSEYRHGNPQAAIEWAEKSNGNSANQWACKSLSFGMLTLAHTKLRDQNAARKAELKLTELLTVHSPFRANAKPGDNWHDWLICELFLRELDQARADAEQ